VDKEFKHLLDPFTRTHPKVFILVDTDTDATEGELSGPFDEAVLEGLKYDRDNGSHGWAKLEAQAADEEDAIALAYTSGTTARPKGVEYTHRGSYLAALGNVIESGLNFDMGRCHYLWTLPMFHAMGKDLVLFYSIPAFCEKQNRRDDGDPKRKKKSKSDARYVHFKPPS
jgi:long-subunit acyl-CoA synthetase (AMP-forming)